VIYGIAVEEISIQVQVVARFPVRIDEAAWGWAIWWEDTEGDELETFNGKHQEGVYHSKKLGLFRLVQTGNEWIVETLNPVNERRVAQV
jgi:hypothetical protein